MLREVSETIVNCVRGAAFADLKRVKVLSMDVASSSHIRLDERGVAWIDDSNIKVIEVALEHVAHGSNAEEIHREHRGYLTRGQIHAALAWYYDHRDVFDEEIERGAKEHDRLRAEHLDSPGRARLKAEGKLS